MVLYFFPLKFYPVLNWNKNEQFLQGQFTVPSESGEGGGSGAAGRVGQQVDPQHAEEGRLEQEPLRSDRHHGNVAQKVARIPR